MLETSKNRNKKLYDRQIKQLDLKLTDKVLLKTEGTHKLSPLYSGPYEIVEIDNSNIKIKHNTSGTESIVHKNRLIKYI